MQVKRFKVVWILFVFIALFAPAASSQAQDTTWSFAFGSPQEADLVIYTVDPLNPDTPIRLLSAPAFYSTSSLHSSDLALSKIEPSPDGHWLALMYTGRDDWQLNLVNISTGEIREIFHSVINNPNSGFDWSSNSQYLAFNASTEPGSYGHLSVYIYNLNTQAIQNIADDIFAVPIHFLWSPTSDKLAIYSVEVSTLGCPGCVGQLTLYDLNTATTALITDLSPLEGLAASAASELLCDLQWSPEGSYLSFVAGCGTGTGIFHIEVYIVGINEGSLQQLTAYTGQTGAFNPERTSDYFARYDMTWYTDQILLVGMRVSQQYWPITQPTQVPDYPPTHQTVAYDIPTGTSTVLIPDKSISEWAVNPTDELVAMANFTAHEEILEAVQLASVMDGRLVIQNTSVPGCNLKWSPDGMILAYTDIGTQSSLHCGSASTIIFMNMTTGEVKEWKFSAGNVIGWIAFPDKQ